jgi:DNA-directed RNA polymerase specialized sigma24 family protein
MVRRHDRRSDEDLLAATAADAEAFAVFYRRHLRSVLAYLVHRTGRPELAADLAAETFAAALQALPRIVEERDYRELAQAWSCSEAVIRQRVSRGLTTLRRRLGAAA